ncbi:hypothetical protein [Jiella marina]|uniref:hypothetical protein n=1 Tax=Jiella sp. LLJ827 TaxID=2917712 RepID=UPI002100A9BA|nr:hypothetical protein [Jiella sp. LLJ827]MCQ0987563.1 hypothetical protein [Jiella sp. LLJ827]
MAFVLRTRQGRRIENEGIALRGAALDRYEKAWHELRGQNDWAVALYECQDFADPDEAVAHVAGGGGLIIAHRDSHVHPTDLLELRWILEGK